MARIAFDIPLSLEAALEREAKRSGRSPDTVVTSALAEYLGATIHTVFQVSTSGALVAGVFDREVSVGAILQHGDFGLGTFAGLDGEMVVLDGRAYRVRGSGEVTQATDDAGVPFAIVTRFAPEESSAIGSVGSLKELGSQCDRLRCSGNIFYALRLDGHFVRLRARAVKPSEPGARLVDAARSQSEFTFGDVKGTLVGVWSPGFSSAFSVPGYHFHFISEDRRHGGHVLDVKGTSLELRIEPLTNFHLALPETEAFLAADLSKNTADELAYSEQEH